MVVGLLNFTLSQPHSIGFRCTAIRAVASTKLSHKHIYELILMSNLSVLQHHFRTVQQNKQVIFDDTAGIFDDIAVSVFSLFQEGTKRSCIIPKSVRFWQASLLATLIPRTPRWWGCGWISSSESRFTWVDRVPWCC